ncbi:SRPBCC family protein [Nesterenkonia lutea]|uniref:Uncharacterized protein YndB with AHSA1/START domain n=1 Tax=Nesterenkonia lutea TaxID=272919 RepID=A0ABR9JF14_9MICC|nr:SRPBCC domain-containing protein [Nesterenkonia lutea]MBE1524353.1 uncharacterized protein YndB with AHSA1/START domain [Nesterenkonia lutea]
MIDESKSFTLARSFAATPEEVWTAWTDPDAAAHWWHPEGLSTPRESVEMDVREGGTYTYTMVDDADGTRLVTGGEYREVLPYERLVFSWGDPKDEIEDCPIVTLVLTPTSEGTHMHFHLAGADGAEGDNFYYDGWNSALDMLGEHLSRR